MSTGFPAAPKGGMNFLKAASKSSGMVIKVRPLSWQASDSSTPEPPAPVIDSFNDVQRARQDKERKQNEAEAYRNRVVPTARGEAAQITQEAEAYKEKVVKDAEGEAKRFLSVYESYRVAKEVTGK